MVQRIIRKHLAYFATLCFLIGIAVSWLSLRALHHSPVSHLVAVAFNQWDCSDKRHRQSYMGISYETGEIRCFWIDEGKITSAHLKYQW